MFSLLLRQPPSSTLFPLHDALPILIQNHSGNGYVGAAMWDIHEMIRDLDPRHMGVHFDIGHATVESGLSWPTAFALRSEEHTSELQSRFDLVCRLLLEKKKKKT